MVSPKHLYFLLLIILHCFNLVGQEIKVAGQPAQLDIRKAGENSIRVTLKPVSFKDDFPYTPALAEIEYASPVISLKKIDKSIKRTVGKLIVEVLPNPLTLIISNKQGQRIQHLTFTAEGTLKFHLNNQPIFGLGGGGSKPDSTVNWRNLAVEYDRRGRYDTMQPRYQKDAYGSRNPAPMLIEPGCWAIFVSSPWVEVDLLNKEYGIFIDRKYNSESLIPQTFKNQKLFLSKGLPPADKVLNGLFDFFVFDSHDPAKLMKDYSEITGKSVLPPKWALGYMQSHRTLEDDKQMLAIVDTFRAKQIPVDAVIYLGTGFTPKGWNLEQPSFEFNPNVFKSDPKEFISDLHKRNVKVILHITPWDRDSLPTLQGTIPPRKDEIVDASHIQTYWNQHKVLISKGVDGFWPDEGDWLNLYERIKRHQLYYQGLLSSVPNTRPWSLLRNGFPGIAQWGGWIWSGDTQSSWKSLEAQIAVGLNFSVSISPFWGTDIGGFFPNDELTGELYARWFQFAAFTPLFRSHGITWQTRLPWGWGLSDMGPKETSTPPLQSEMNNKTIEPITKKFDELRYQLLSYNYTLAYETRSTGMPMMRPLWLQYPDDEIGRKIGDQYLWGSEMLIAPVYQKNATSRKVYLPKGDWYNWWTNKKESGEKTINCKVDLSTIPIYVHAGAIIPFDPVRQYTNQEVSEPTLLKVFKGADGQFTLYDDDGISLDYINNTGSWIKISWNEKEKELTLASESPKGAKNVIKSRTFTVQLLPDNEIKTISFNGKTEKVKF